MRRSLVCAAMAGAALFVGTASAQTFIISLDGLQQVPAADTTANGTGFAMYDAAERRLRLHVDFTGLVAPETLAHIHRAPAGENGPIIQSLPLGTPIDGTFNLSAANEAALLAGELYVNVHTTMFPSGELRGQIVAGEFRGACCMKADGCAEMTRAGCAAAGGFYQGDNSRCVDECGAPMLGACCLGTTCQVMSPLECGAQGGEYEGNGSVCSGGSCQEPPRCPCDYNFDQSLNSQDFFDFLPDFFSGRSRGDYNSDGVVNSQDFFDFLSCFFSRPDGCR